MIEVTSIKQLRETIEQWKREGKQIGFVPTMGYLHEGHLALLQEAKKENDVVVLSIFVNPLQFGPTEDFETYPRDYKRDRKLAESVSCDMIFTPTVSEMYPEKASIELKVTQGTHVLCGKSRPGHFDGVVTVVSKLFHFVEPHRAYFGMKDAQQVAIIEMLVRDLNFPAQIRRIPTVREIDGLAKSSRNVRLQGDERIQAPRIFEALQLAKQLIESGERNQTYIIAEITEMIHKHIKAEIDYVEILTYPGLEKKEFTSGTFIVAIAVRFQQVRLIDNLLVHL
jgi:pantoate--beta-alanine ligase